MRDHSNKSTMQDDSDDNGNRVPFSMLLDETTMERLRRLSDVCDADPRSVAASLLHDILQDDAEAEGSLLLPPHRLN